MYNPQNYPQPPQPHYQPPSYPPPPLPGPVSLDLIGQAWQLVTAKLGIWIIAFVISCIPSAVYLIFEVLTPQLSNELKLVVNLVMTIPSWIITAGMIRMALSQIRTGDLSLNQLMLSGSSLFNAMGAGFLITLASIVSFMCCIVPYFFVSSLLMLMLPLIVDKELNAINSIGKSIELTKPHLSQLVVLTLVLNLILVASFVCCIALLFTIPIATVTVALIYVRLVDGQNQNLPPQVPNAYPPITNPFN